MKKFILILSVAAIAICSSIVIGHDDDQVVSMNAHLTLYVEGALLEKGGTVLVVSKTVPLERWNALPKASAEQTWIRNPKRSELADNDRLFEAGVSASVSIVEFIYPEGGSSSFNLVAVPLKSDGQVLKTKRILVGGGYYVDLATGEKHVWNDVSTIHVYGPDATEGYSRAVRMASGEIMNGHPHRTTTNGAVVSVPSDEVLARVVVTEAK